MVKEGVKESGWVLARTPSRGWCSTSRDNCGLLEVFKTQLDKATADLVLVDDRPVLRGRLE